MSKLSRHEIALKEAAKLRCLILQLYDAGNGLTQSEIARKVRLSRARVNQIVKSAESILEAA